MTEQDKVIQAMVDTMNQELIRLGRTPSPETAKCLSVLMLHRFYDFKNSPESELQIDYGCGCKDVIRVTHITAPECN